MRERQAAQLAAALILRAGRAVGVRKLMKLMYLAETEAMKRSGFPIAFDDIYAMRQGMVLSRTLDLMKHKAGTVTNGEWNRHIARPSYRGVDVQRGITEASLDGLSSNDIEVIDSVWNAHGSKNVDELVHVVHHGLGEWIEHWGDRSRKSGAVKVSYAKLYESVVGMSKVDAADVAEEVAYFKAMGDSGERATI